MKGKLIYRKILISFYILAIPSSGFEFFVKM